MFIMRRKLFCFTLFLIIGIVLVFEIPFISNRLQTSSLIFDENDVTGIVTDVDQIETDFFQLIIKADDKKILASYYQELEKPWTFLGQRIIFRAEVELPAEAGNPRTFDYRRYLLSRGIHYVCVIESFTVERSRPSVFYYIKSTILEKRETYMQKLAIEGLAEGLLRGLLFGDKSHMDETIYNDFRKNGTAHVLAVSGLHVGMLYGVYRWLYDRWKRRWLTTVFLCFLFVYGTAALWSVSVTRAIGLIVLVVLGKATCRRYDLLTALSVAALFSVIKNPYVIYGAGFHMSFLAVLSITFFQRPLAKHIGEKWAPALAVQVGMLPYMAYTFNYVSFVGILCNIPVIFLASILVPLGMAGFIGFLVLDMILPGLSQILSAVTKLMIWCNSLFSADGILSFDVVSPPLWLMILIYGLLFFCTSEYFHIYFSRKDWKKILSGFLVIAVLVWSGLVADRTPFDKADIVFVDVGQGDCLHLKAKDNLNILIDGGGKSGYNTGEKTLKPYLLKNRIRNIDLAAATHLHLDHYAGLEELAACYPVEQMLTKGKAGQIIKIDENCSLEILWPKKQNPDIEDENENSLIFMVHYNGVHTLVTGDITQEGEHMLLEAYKGSGKLQADILKIAHHGSPYSTCDAFLDAVKPKVAVISVGRNNYGHPSEMVIEKLEKRGIIVFRTDLDGAVGIIHRKGKLSVCTEKRR